MKQILRKFTLAIVTVLVASIFFVTAIPVAAEESPQIGEISISWSRGFLQNNVA